MNGLFAYLPTFYAKKIDVSLIMCLYHQVLKPIVIRIFLVGFLISLSQLVAFRIVSGAALPDETIRVAIFKNAATVIVDGEGIIAIRENGDAVALRPPVMIRPAKNGVVVNDTTYRRLTFSAASAIYVNGKPYRGTAEITLGEKGILVVNELPLEEYLVGLINCEISSAWPIEAVKAQAVIARTYALNRKEARRTALYHLESSVIDQVYNGCEIEDSRARRAVSDTAGEVLTYNGAIIQAFYHSSCGGRTESSENVWGKRLPYLSGVDCEYCLLSPSSAWEQKISLLDIEAKLKIAGYTVFGVTDIRAGQRNNRGRLKNIVIVSTRGELSVPAVQFRKIMGYGVVKSTNFTVKVVNGEANFSGLGNGHGVGLCQWGAKQRALAGFSYAEILSYYYPGTKLTKFSDIR
ncbi:MAG: SpoIID/LytB domain-containing protein [Geobacteraceae bacterium]|nr:SpoIID/LytB domain-containing protein [Geobacteraceae bacterium]